MASAAAARNDRSIRTWPTNPMSLPQQSDKVLQAHRSFVLSLDFSPDDSNLLASGDSWAVKLWSVEQEVRTCNFDHACGRTWSLHFSALEEGCKRIFATSKRSLIRTCSDDLSGITSDIVDTPGLVQVQRSAISCCGSLLAASGSRGGHAVTLCDMANMAVAQRPS